MRTKLILAALAAALVMAFATTGASARNLSISHGELFNAIWREIRLVSGGISVFACDLTLEGSFHYRTMTKTPEALVGYVTRARGNCSPGSATVLTARLPWHIRYGGFEGALPRITGVRYLIVEFELRYREPSIGAECLMRTTNTRPMVGVARLAAGSERRLVTAMTTDPTPRISCGALFELGFEGTGTFTELPGGSSNVLVRLI
jgi:hypothetical protein